MPKIPIKNDGLYEDSEDRFVTGNSNDSPYKNDSDDDWLSDYIFTVNCLEYISAMKVGHIQPALTKAACVSGWRSVFKPDLNFISQHSALCVAALCASSVGITPYFADKEWIRLVALPFFRSFDNYDDCFHWLQTRRYSQSRIALNPTNLPIYIKEQSNEWINKLDLFLIRESIAQTELDIGGLTKAGARNNGLPLVRIEDFVAFAESRNPSWELPLEFPRPEAPADEALADNVAIDDSEVISIARQQETLVLQKITELGYTPKSLPPNKPGKSNVKAEVRRKLVDRYLLTDSQFIETWKRLLRTKQIAYEAKSD